MDNTIWNIIVWNDNDKINGLSISPKKDFNILKLWFSENIEYKTKFIEKENSNINLSNSIYKKHIIEK